jgi:mycothiol synthase
MKPVMRGYQTEEDYWRIRPFLREVFQLNGLRGYSWHVARWDYWHWPGVESWGDGLLVGRVFIWEMPDGQIAAVLNPESHGHAFLQVHPGLRTRDLEEEMLDVAEQYLATPGPNGQRRLTVWADGQDTVRRALLQQRGYVKGDWPEHQHRRTLSEPIPDVPVAEGFIVRSLGGVDELPARAWSSWKAFHPQAPDEEYANVGWRWYLDIQRCPLYRRDLDIVAVTPNGDLASFCTVWYDDVTRSAYFEPVGTYTSYQRRGLGRAVMTEGLRRLQRMGALVAFVGGYSPEANALYTAVMGPEHDLLEPWIRESA